jgi:hypothetical protein
MDANTIAVAKDCATIVAAVIAAFSLVVALRAFRANRQNQRDTIVQRAFSDYLKMAMDHPEFAFPPDHTLDHDAQTFDGKAEEFGRYEWYLSGVLNTVHLILEVEGDTPLWRETMHNQIAYHWQYLKRFRKAKPFLVNWDTRLAEALDAGITLGETRYAAKTKTPIASPRL